jgi:riboflavin kinase/FMN adenylyltransferase
MKSTVDEAKALSAATGAAGRDLALKTPENWADIPCVVALGTFDGVHIGHQALIRQAVTLARKHGWRSVVYTFENHPRGIYDKMPVLLMDAATRKAALYGLGVDRVDMVKFTKTLAERSAEAFIKRLTAKYGVRAIVAGSDFTFGYKGAGTLDTLRSLGARLGFEVYETPDVLLDGEKVSSTRIRQALEHGDVRAAAKMLGR